MTDIVGFEGKDLGDYQEAADGDIHASATLQNQSNSSSLRVIIAESQPSKDAKDYYLIKAGDERPFSGFEGKLYHRVDRNSGYVKSVVVRTEV